MGGAHFHQWGGAMATTAPPAKKRKKTKPPFLIVLDMNGVLLKRTDSYDHGTLRPHLEKLIDTMWNHYPRLNVAVWSSMMAKNLNPLVKLAFGERADGLAFVWDQEWCTKLSVRGMSKPLLRKDLEWLESSPFAFYAPANVLLVDDDPVKCTENPKGTALHPATFDGTPDDELWYVAEYLDFLAKSDCATVPEFVKNNPYKRFKRALITGDAGANEDFDVVEVYVEDDDAWCKAKFVEELSKGSVRIEWDDGSTLDVPADHVRDPENTEGGKKKKKKGPNSWKVSGVAS